MTEHGWIGDTRLVGGDDQDSLLAAVQKELRSGVRSICVDASSLQDLAPDPLARSLERCARIALRVGGDLVVVCPMGAVRSALVRARIPVVSDRLAAETVLAGEPR